MNCDCVNKVNTKLSTAGYEYSVATAIVFDDKMNGTVRLEVPTYWNDIHKRTKKKPPSLLCTYCPFCGEPAVAKEGE